MSKITYNGSYVDWFDVDGKQIRDHTPARVHWPDGSVSIVSLRVREWSTPDSEMGTPFNMSHRHIGVEIGWRGIQDIWVQLKEGTELELVGKH